MEWRVTLPWIAHSACKRVYTHLTRIGRRFGWNANRITVCNTWHSFLSFHKTMVAGVGHFIVCVNDFWLDSLPRSCHATGWCLHEQLAEMLFRCYALCVCSYVLPRYSNDPDNKNQNIPKNSYIPFFVFGLRFYFSFTAATQARSASTTNVSTTHTSTIDDKSTFSFGRLCCGRFYVLLCRFTLDYCSCCSVFVLIW